MKIENVKRREPKSVSLSIRTTKEFSKFMRDKDISPNAVFHEAVKGLMEGK